MVKKATSRGRAKVSQAKAKEILRDGTVHGQALSKKQRGLFGLIAGGKKPSRMKKKGKR